LHNFDKLLYDARLKKEREKMSRLPRIGLLSILVLAGLACGLISNPISGAQNFASTAQAFASAIPSGFPSGIPNMPDITRYLSPTGTPAKEWNGVPIMAQAKAGEEFDKNTYSFRASGITAADVQTYYSDKMKSLGWSSTFTTLAGSEGGVMVFTKGASNLTITVAPADQDTVVLLIQQ
jgi:hypothetical protein